jgi:hypothetical protein
MMQLITPKLLVVKRFIWIILIEKSYFGKYENNESKKGALP